MKMLIPSLAFIALTACSSEVNHQVRSKSEHPKLTIIQTTFQMVGDSSISKDSLYELDTEYFSMSVSSQTSKEGVKYIPVQHVEQLTVSKPRSIDLYIAGPDKKFITFPTPTDFLNFMDAHGYEMRTEQKEKYGAQYTFKRKS